MLLLELNEFDPELMRAAAGRLQARQLQRLLSLHHSHTRTDDQDERAGLDPWVQWVSIHTGQPSAAHGIKHLGDVENLKCPQLWELLEAKGISYGIWGAMNASKGKAARHCRFFFPDPWTFSEAACPGELNDFLALPRYYSKNYLDLDGRLLAVQALKLLRFILRPGIFWQLGQLLPFVLSHWSSASLRSPYLFSLFDLVNTRLFCHYYRKSKPRFAVLFLNSVAHAQHHCWVDRETLSKEMVFCFSVIDRCLDLIFSTIDEQDLFMAANAFKQTQSYAKNEYLYRQVNPHTFFRDFNLNPVRVEQLMTNDSQLFFASPEQAETAGHLLNEARIQGLRAFEATRDRDDPCKLFCQFIVWKDIGAGAAIAVGPVSKPFYEHFEKVVRRSGVHTQEGDLFTNKEIAPERLYNHDIFKLILNGCNLS